MFVKRALLVTLFLLVSSVCLASMTIYFKDGSSRQVHKITFRGSQADLYLLDGTLSTVDVERIDLPSSGIGIAVGTYGQTKVKTVRPSGSKPLQIADTEKQARLQLEWEKSEETAVAINSIGQIRRGDTVKIVDQSRNPAADAATRKSPYAWNSSNNTTVSRNPDQAYVVVYRNSDGSYGKSLFDAVTFNNNFRTNRPAKPVPLAKELRQREKVAPVPRLAPDPVPPAIPKPPEIIDEPDTEPEASRKSPSVTLQPEKKKDYRVPLIIGGLLLTMVVVGFVLFKHREKPLVDTSRFAKYEEDLREFEIGIWLKNGKTMDQLIEICLKKFFQENASVLGFAMKIWKGAPKSSMIPMILKQTGRTGAEAEELYEDIGTRITFIRQLIAEVSARTGLAPAQAEPVQSGPVAAVATSKTIASVPSSVLSSEPRPAPGQPLRSSSLADVSVPVANAQKVVGGSPGTSSIAPIANIARKPAVPLKTPPRNNSDLPPYANHLLSQLASLSSSDSKE